MPSTIAWNGNAVAVAQVQTGTVGGTVETDDIFRATIGTKVLSVAAGSSTPATVATTIRAAWNALTAASYPQFAEITAGGSGADVVLTCDTAGRAFVCTLTTVEANEDAADDQTFASAATTANAGPLDWSTAGNWSGGVAPVTGDTVILENSDKSIAYGLAQSGAVTLAVLRVENTYTGEVGLPRTNADGTEYPEYRLRYLTIGATVADLRTKGRFNLDCSTIQTATTINSEAVAVEADVPPILWKGTHASNTLTVNRGDVGVAVYAGETAVIATLTVNAVGSQSETSVVCGSGTTLTTIVINGGYLTIESNATTINQYGGTLYIEGAPTVTTLNLYGGACYPGGIGTITITNLNIGDGTFDCRQGSGAITVTNCAASPGAIILDPAKRVTWTNGIDLTRCGIAAVTIDLGEHLTITPTAI